MKINDTIVFDVVETYCISLKKFHCKSNFSDFKIISSNNVHIPCHKIILSLCSKYFEAIFELDPNATEIQVPFNDNILKNGLEAVYGKLKLQSLIASEIISIFEFFIYFRIDKYISLVTEVYDKLDVPPDSAIKYISLATSFCKQGIISKAYENLYKCMLSYEAPITGFTEHNMVQLLNYCKNYQEAYIILTLSGYDHNFAVSIGMKYFSTENLTMLLNQNLSSTQWTHPRLRSFWRRVSSSIDNLLDNKQCSLVLPLFQSYPSCGKYLNNEDCGFINVTLDNMSVINCSNELNVQILHISSWKCSISVDGDIKTVTISPISFNIEDTSTVDNDESALDDNKFETYSTDNNTCMKHQLILPDIRYSND